MSKHDIGQWYQHRAFQRRPVDSKYVLIPVASRVLWAELKGLIELAHVRACDLPNDI